MCVGRQSMAGHLLAESWIRPAGRGTWGCPRAAASCPAAVSGKSWWGLHGAGGQGSTIQYSAEGSGREAAEERVKRQKADEQAVCSGST